MWVTCRCNQPTSDCCTGGPQWHFPAACQCHRCDLQVIRPHPRCISPAASRCYHSCPLPVCTAWVTHACTQVAPHPCLSLQRRPRPGADGHLPHPPRHNCSPSTPPAIMSPAPANSCCNSLGGSVSPPPPRPSAFDHLLTQLHTCYSPVLHTKHPATPTACHAVYLKVHTLSAGGVQSCTPATQLTHQAPQHL